MSSIYLVVNQDTLNIAQMGFLLFTICVAFSFEFINGFHDTANAVATVIYTKSMKPWKIVTISGVCNFAGVLTGGTAVAFTIVHLLPVNIILDVGSNVGQSMLLALLLAAIIWNFGTWQRGLPASSSHTLIGSIVGVWFAHSFISGVFYGGRTTMNKLAEVFISLLTSPVVGFLLSFLLVTLILRVSFLKYFNETPSEHKEHKRPRWTVRLPTILSSAAVSFTHGSNDGQKGMGIIMLILIGMLPGHFAVNMAFGKKDIQETVAAVSDIHRTLKRSEAGMNKLMSGENLEEETKKILRAKSVESASAPLAPLIYLDLTPLYIQLENVKSKLDGKNSLEGFAKDQLWDLRNQILMINESVKDIIATERMSLTKEQKADLKKNLKIMCKSVEYVPFWVMMGVALCLGIGTMIGWKRVAVTIGEKIGKKHMTYGQGVSAQLMAAVTIFCSNMMGLPVSTTHILSSGVAGGMVANKAGLHSKTLMSILMAWILTLPASMALSAVLYTIFRLVL
jgi:phosphate/sulfate permease